MEINNEANREHMGIARTTKSPCQRPGSRRPLSHVSSCSTRMHQRSFANYWSVENFSVQLELHSPGEFMLAPKFGDAEYEFVMKLFPNGKDEETSGYLSLFLLINKCPNPRLRFRVSFTVETRDGPRSCHLNKNLVTINRSGIVTASKFFSLDILRTATDIYTPNDILTIGCELTIFGEALTWSTNLFNPYSRGLNTSSSSRSESSNTLDKQSFINISEEVQQDGLNELLDTGDFSDFTVVSSCGREFPTHMCVLSSRSDYFKALLRNQSTTEFASKRVKFEDISAETLEVLLRHIYNTTSEHMSLEENQLTPELISAVDRLIINTMRPEIARNLSLNVTPENVVVRISMAAELRLEDTYQSLLEFFASHKKEAMNTTMWNDMRIEKPSMAIKILEDAILCFEEPTGAIDRRIIDRITLA
uniref:BTB domain-containing protein n=2 Tax=Caenorhabditis tropicalis TaxID=1561998 RepID=A0A1I7U3H6_9PELO